MPTGGGWPGPAGLGPQVLAGSADEGNPTARPNSTAVPWYKRSMPTIVSGYFKETKAWWLLPGSAPRCSPFPIEHWFGGIPLLQTATQYYWWLVLCIASWTTRFISAGISSELQKAIFGQGIKTFFTGTGKNEIGQGFQPVLIPYEPDGRKQAQSECAMLQRHVKNNWEAAVLGITDKTGDKLHVDDIPHLSKDRFPIKLILGNGDPKDLRQIISKTWNDIDSEDFQKAKVCGGMPLSGLALISKAVGFHLIQIGAWTISSLLLQASLNCIGVWLQYLVTLRELLYGVLLLLVLWKHPEAILFNMKKAAMKEKLLYILSPEKYFLIVLVEKGTLKAMTGRALFLLITLGLDMVGIAILLLGAPPPPMAAMLFLMGLDGCTVDWLGAICGN